MNYNFLTIGGTCKPTSALIELGYRKFALPFDWVQMSIESLEKCFKEEFRGYHKNLTLNSDNKRVIDGYGFEFPHDYPTTSSKYSKESKIFEEDVIVSNWREYYEMNVKKYERRIERFLNIVRSNKPIIILTQYLYNDVLKLRELLKMYYNKTNVFFINSTVHNHEEIYKDYNIINIFTESKGKWNDIEVWRPVVDMIIRQIPEDISY
jgi:hypothetical protein